MLRYDLIIVGGGLVGAGLALALHQTGWRIALVNAKTPSNEDPRLFALNHSSCQFLKNLKVWSALAAHAEAIQQVHVSHQGHFGSVRLQSKEVDLETLGHVIPACHIEAALNEALLALSHVTLYQPATLTALQQNEQTATLTLNTMQGELTLTAPLVIGADGTLSTVRTQLNLPTREFDYGQSALVTTTSLQRSHAGIAYERFTKTGAIAMLPLNGKRCASIWSAEQALINHFMTLSDADFLHALQTEFGYRLGRLQQIGKRFTYPLRLVTAEKTVDQCVLLLGNAAHTLHPIAAQGLNLALYEVALLVDLIQAKIKTGDSFSAVQLQEMSAQIQNRQAKSIELSHKLTQIFSHPNAYMSIGLQLGMIGFNRSSFVKKRFINSVIGRTGCVPSLLLGQKGL